MSEQQETKQPDPVEVNQKEESKTPQEKPEVPVDDLISRLSSRIESSLEEKFGKLLESKLASNLTKDQVSELVQEAISKTIPKEDATPKKESKPEVEVKPAVSSPKQETSEIDAKMAAFQKMIEEFDAKTKAAEERAVQNFRKEQERLKLAQYKEDQIKKHGILFGELVTGKTEAEIDASVKAVKEKENKALGKAKEDAIAQTLRGLGQMIPKGSKIVTDAETGNVSVGRDEGTFSAVRAAKDMFASRIVRR